MNVDFKSSKSSMSKIFSMARYDITSNFSSWFSLLGVQTIICMLLLSYHFLPGNFEVSFLDIFFGLGSFEFLLGDEYFNLGLNVYSLLIVTKLIMAMVVDWLMHIIFPIMLLQNALDLAFDSSMRGFSIKGPVAIYVLVVHAFFISRGLMINFGDNLMEYLTPVAFASWLEIAFLLLSFVVALILYNYVFQRLRFVGLHLFEYQLGVKKTIQASYEMTRGKLFFLSAISMVQIFVMFLALLISACIFNLVSSLFHFLLLNMSLSFMTAEAVYLVEIWASRIFRIVFWLTLIMWYYLVEAHTYRQLVCPATNKSGCQSCECAS